MLADTERGDHILSAVHGLHFFGYGKDEKNCFPEGV